MVLNELVDTDVAYADLEDVEDHYKAVTFDNQSDPTGERVQELLYDASERIDNYTNRAWRERRVVDRELRVQLSRVQEQAIERRRNLHRVLPQTDQWGTVTLPHPKVREWDPQEDSLEVLLPRSIKDITDNEGREDGDFILDYQKGVLRVHMSLFRRGPLRKRGTGLVERPRVRISYRYGHSDESIPGDIRRATALLVAAQLIDSDQYGTLVPGGDDATDQQAAADRYHDRAWDTIRRYRYTRLVM